MPKQNKMRPKVVHTFLKRGVRIEERNRQETGDRVEKASSDYCNSLKFIIHSPYICQSKGERKRFHSHDTRNKLA